MFFFSQMINEQQKCAFGKIFCKNSQLPQIYLLCEIEGKSFRENFIELSDNELEKEFMKMKRNLKI